MISRFKPSAWLVAATSDPGVERALFFSYGVFPFHIEKEPENWAAYAANWLKEEFREGGSALLISGPSPREPEANYRMEFLKF
jgi:pyruvate kinase